MALSTEELLKLKTAEHNAMRHDFAKTLDLLEYYRSMVQTNDCRAQPPPHFWVKAGRDCWVWGLLIDGELTPQGKAWEREDAVEACWKKYDKMHPRQTTQQPPPARDHIDLDDLVVDEPARKSRRRRIDDE